MLGSYKYGLSDLVDFLETFYDMNTRQNKIFPMFISFQNLLCLEDVEEGYLGPVQWEGRAITQVVGPSR